MAGLIPQSFIDDLLNRTDIADVVEERVNLKRTGRNYSGLCPFHKEKTPSFSVNPEKQFYYCFGCGAAGNAIGFVMEHDRLEFPEAVELLARRIGLEVPHEASTQHSEKTERLKDSYDILAQSAEYYQQQLRHHAEREKAVSYLKERGLSGQIAKRFQIGFAPPGWDNLIQHLNKTLEKAPSEQQLDEAGMVIYRPEDKKCYDRFRDRIMFPIIDMRGRVIAFGGRVLTDEKPKYLNSPETPTFHKAQELYGLYQARQANRTLSRIIIVEGYMDVVALAQFGINNAVATLGTATSEHHLTRLFKLVPEVIFCFDGDAAGRKAAHRALETALPVMEDGLQAAFLFLPEGEDPDSLVRQEGTEAFEQRMNQALPLSSFFFDAHSEGLDLNSHEGRARLSAKVMPLLDKIPGRVLQELMRQKLAEITGLSQEFMAQLGQSSVIPSQPDPIPASNPSPTDQDPGFDYSDYVMTEPVSPVDNYSPTPRPRRQFPMSTLGERAIKTLLHFPTFALKVDLETTDHLADLNDPELQLLKALIEKLRQQPDTATVHILLDWQDHPQFETLKSLAEQELLVTDADTLGPEFIDCLHLLVRKREQSHLNELKLKMKNGTPLSVEERKLFSKLLSKK